MRGNLFGIFTSALNLFGKFIIRSLIVKFVVFFALFFIVHGFTQIMLSLVIPAGMSAAGLNGLFANIPPSIWYFMDVFAFDYGFPLILSAYVVSFIIRRIPIIGG